MKRYPATAWAASLGVAALAGCVPPVQQAPVSSEAAVPPLLESMPGTPVPVLKTSSTEGLAERVSGHSENSPVRQMLAGTFAYEPAVPGSLQLLHAKRSEGGQRAVIPLDGGANGLGFHVWRSEKTRFHLGSRTATRAATSGVPAVPATPAAPREAPEACPTAWGRSSWILGPTPRYPRRSSCSATHRCRSTADP